MKLLVVLALVSVIGCSFMVVYLLHLPLQFAKDQLMAAMEWLMKDPFNPVNDLLDGD
ncbi:hypothetical protein [Methylobacter sp.]|uniref:hypothetical protein n=1 Tax=Methylobacter sp. TaxID=2051955 RepID=UPI0025DA3AD2|nr:hypothetical protein [Methylobacter sp.]